MNNGIRCNKVRRTLALLVSVSMVLGSLLFPDTALAATDKTLASGGTLTMTAGDDWNVTTTGTLTNAQIVVPTGVTATLRVPGNLTIDDRANGKSPIDIRGNGNLTLIVSGTLTLYGGNAGDGKPNTTESKDSGGTSGYAAISVPNGAFLTVDGISGAKLYAYGGDAGDGGIQVYGNTSHLDQGGGGGGGAGAGIGGNGGSGGAASRGAASAGVSAGNIKLYGNLTIYTYGGGGGSGGGTTASAKATSGGGGGGYPAAGVGGGGAGGGAGDTAAAGGGFSGGGGENSGAGGTDGNGGKHGATSNWHSGGGGYFSVGETGGGQYPYYSGGAIGGGNAKDGSSAESTSWVGSVGGTAGSGGAVEKSNTATLIAYNGSFTTTSAGQWGKNQTPIYWQNGYSLETARSNNATTQAEVQATANYNAGRILTYQNTSAGNSRLGVGSGAGYSEVSNGTYKVVNVPNQVAAPSLTVTKDSIAVKWTAPAANTYSITGYHIYLNGTLKQTVAAGTTNATITGLASGQAYKIQVAAYSQAGEGEKSAEVSATTWVKPTAPTNVVATVTGSKTVSLTWGLPTDLGGGAVTGYTVSGGGTASVNTVSRTATISGLTPGTSYTFSVAATTGAGTGPAATAAAVKTWNVPSAPVISSVTPTNKAGELQITWAHPADNGQSIDKYYLYVDGAAAKPESVNYVAGSSQSAIITGLTDGKSVNITIKAHNSVGLSNASNSVTGSSRSVPGAPATVTATTLGADSVRIDWTEPVKNGADITKYKLVWTEGGSQKEREFAVSDSELTKTDTGYSYTMTGLNAGANYTFSVAAYNVAGYGGAKAGNMVTTHAKPSAPRNLKVGSADGEILVEWDEPSSIGGTSVTSYTVYVYDDATVAENASSDALDGYVYTTSTTDGNTHSVTLRLEDIGELVTGQEYYFRVLATNTVGMGPLSGTSSTRGVDKPSVAGNFAATVTGDRTVTLTWDPANANGATVDSYRIAVTDEKDQTIVTNIPAVEFPDGADGVLKQEALITGLQPDTTYTFSVYAHNTQGEGLPAKMKARTMRVPYAPTDVAAKPTGQSGEATVAWTASDKNVGTPIVQYVLTVKDGSGLDVTAGLAITYPADRTQTTAVVGGLQNGETYTITVQGHNAIGDGDVSAAAAVTPFRPAEAPGNVAAVITNGETVTLSWSAPEDGGSPIREYRVFVRDASGEDITDAVTISYPEDRTQTGATVGGLTKGGIYRFQVEAVTGTEDTGDVIGGLADSSLVVMWNTPSVPQNVEAVPNNTTGSVQVTWEAPENNGDTVEGDENPENHTKVHTYYIYWKEQSSTENAWKKTEAISADAPLTYELTGLTDGTVYEMKVSAENGAGESDKSAAAAATPRRIPEAPVIGAVLTGDGCAVISTVTPNVDNGGDPVVAYNLYAIDADANFLPTGEPQLKATIPAEDGVALENALVPDLINGRNYIITAKAVNGAGANGGLPSNRETVRVGMPLTPENLNVSLGANLAVNIAFDPAVDNGTPIDEYIVLIQVNNGQEETRRFTTTSGQFLGTENGDTVQVRVASVNAVGQSPFTTTQTVVIGATTTPVIENVVMHSDKVDVLWEPVASNGNKIKEYYVYLDGVLIQKLDSSRTNTEILKTGGTAVEDNSAITLVPGQNYALQVSAYNMAGESPKSAPWTFCFGVPQAPTVQDVTFGPGTLTVSFTAPEDNGGEAVTAYKVYVNDVLNLDLSIDSEALDYDETTECYRTTVSGLANGSVYNVQVSAVNLHGEGALSTEKNGSPATQASEPRSVLATAVSATEATLSWKAPAYNGGGEISGYKITVLDGEGNVLGNNQGLGDIVITQDAAHETAVSISNLTKGATYSFVVQALTRAKEGAEGKSGRITTFIEPGAPVIKTLTSGNANSNSLPVTVTWDAPENAGGTSILGYNVYSGGVKKNATLITETSYTIQNMVRGRSYSITVKAVNSVGESVASEAKSIRVGIPGAPVVTQITTDASSFTIHWEIVEGVTSGYRIYRVGDPIAMMTITNPESTTAYLDDLVAGEVYEIYMTAYNDQGDGTKTDVYEIVIGAPSPVELSSVTPGFEKVSVSWQKPAVPQPGGGVDAEQLQVAGYEVYVDGVLKADIDNPDALTCDIEGLTGGETYDVKVRAYNRVGTNGKGVGLFSSTLSATPWSKPGLPEIIEIIPGDASFTAVFTEPNGNGAPVSGYKVYMGRNLDEAGTAPEALTEVPGSNLLFDGTSVQVSGVENGTPAHRIYVAAVTAPSDGSTQESEAPVAGECLEVITGIPAAPVITKVLPGSEEVEITFTKPVTVGTAIEGYTVDYREYDVENDLVLQTGGSVEINENQYTLTGLINGKSYAIKVNAHNSIGDSLWSSRVLVTIGTPAAPVIQSGVGGNGFVDLEWSVPQSNASDIYLYKIYADGDFVKETTVPSAQLTGLVNGTKYLIQVTALNRQGESTKSEPVAVTPGTVPDAPENVLAKATGKDSVEITWEKPLNDGGLPIANYVVTGTGVTETGDNVTYNGLSAVIHGLEEGVSYTFKVKAVNAAGEGGEAPAGPVVTFRTPAAPVWDSISSANCTITAEWTAPRDNGGTEILGYCVYVDDVRDNAELIVPTEDNTNPDTGTIRYTVENNEDNTKLEIGTKYRITITAVNMVGEGTPSDGLKIEVNPESVATVPGRPVSLAVTEGNGEVALSWKAPAYDGNSPLTGYYVFVNGEQKYFTGANVRTQKITGLTNGREYEFYVKAVNAEGSSLQSASVFATPYYISAPGAPENLGYKNNSTMNLMTVFWDAPTSGSGPISYNVYVNTVQVATGLENTQLTMEVTSGVTYNIMVEAVNAGGVTPSNYIRALNTLNVMSDNINVDTNLDADYDGVQDAVDEAKVPGVPTNLEVTKNGSASLTLTWVAPGVDGGAPITSYNVYINGAVENVPVAEDGSLSHTITTEPNKTYTLMVAAVNEVGEGGKSSPFAVFVAASTAPSDLVAELNKENNTISIRWSAPVGVTVDGYHLYINGADVNSGLLNETSYSYVGKANQEYIIRVSAVVGGEESRQTNAVNISTMIVTPSAPQNLTASAPEGNQTTLSWEAPAKGDVSSYTLYVNGTAAVENLAADAVTYDYSLAPNTDYTIQIAAVVSWTENGAIQTRESEKSNPVSLSTKTAAPGAPDTPSIESVDIREDGTGFQVDITWTAVGLPENAASICYKFYVNDVCVDSYTKELVAPVNKMENQQETPGTPPAADEETPDNALPEETTPPTGGDNTQPDDNTTSGVTPAPETPEENTQQGSADGTTENNGNDAPEEPTGTAEPNVELLALTLAGDTIQVTLSHRLEKDMDYVFQVSAVAMGEGVTEIGEGVEGLRSAGVFASTKTPVVTPDAPTNLKAELVGGPEGAQIIRLTWDAPGADAPAFDKYVLTMDGTSFDISVGTQTYDFAVIEGKTEYTFYISAVNGAGSAKSNIATISTKSEEEEPKPDIAGAPTITGSVSDGTSLVKVVWTAPTENAADITGYTVSKDSGVVTFAAGTKVLLEDGSWQELAEETNTLPAAARGVLFTDIYDDELHPVVVAAVKEKEVAGGGTVVWTGTSSNTWNISRNLNIDKNAGANEGGIPETPTDSIDADGNGQVDVIGKVIKLKGTIQAGGPAVDPTVKVIDQYNNVIAVGTVAGDQFEAAITINTASGTPVVPEEETERIALFAEERAEDTYTLVVTKDKCTSYTLTGISINVSAEEVDLGTAVLYAGDLTGDGAINIDDMSILLSNYGKTSVSADITGDELVNIDDMSILLSNYGKAKIAQSWNQ